MTTTVDSQRQVEQKAMQQMVRALEKISPEKRGAVLDYIKTLFGITTDA